MTEPNLLAEALSMKDFKKATALIKEGEQLTTGLTRFDKSAIFNNIIRHGAYDIAIHLLQDGNIEKDLCEYDSFNDSIFESICAYLPGDTAAIAFLQSFLSKIENISSDAEDTNLLGFALQEGACMAVVKGLADAGCSVSYKNNAEENFIHQVVSNNALAMRNEARAVEYLDYLIQAGADIDSANVVGKTALLTAIEYNRHQYTALLLKNGANPNHQDNEGNTAFYYAVIDKRDKKLYDLLSEFASPKFDLLNRKDSALLPVFMERIGHPSDADLQLLEKLIRDGADIHQTSPYYDRQKCALDWAAEKSVNVLELMIRIGNLEINHRDNSGNTLLHKVCAFNINFDREAAKETYRKVKLLIERGASVTMLNDKDETALMLALKDNLKSKTAELLLSIKA